MNKAKLLSFGLLSFFSLVSKAQTVYLDSTFNYQGIYEWGWSVLNYDDSSYIIQGSGGDSTFNNDALLYNTNFNGKINWLKTVSKNGYDFYVGLSGSFKRTLDGNFIVAGGVEKFNPNDQDAILIKYNSIGDTIFIKYYGGDFKNAYNCAILSDSGYALIGYNYIETSNNVDILLIRTNKNGNKIFSKTYGGVEDDVGFTIHEISGNRLVLCGVKKYLPNYAPWIIITDSTGNVMKEKEWNTGILFCGGGRLLISLENQFIYYGCIDSVEYPGDYPYTPAVVKLDTNFNILWKTAYFGQQEKSIYIIRQLDDSSIVFVGFNNADNGYNRGWIGKMDKDGNKIWERYYQHGTSSFNYFADFQQTPDKGFIITGSTLGPTGQDLWLVKLDSLGCLVPNCEINSITFEVGDTLFSLNIFPNPATEQATILFNIPLQERKATISVFDLHGRKMNEFEVASSEHSITLNIESYFAGVYFVLLNSQGKIITAKLLKQ